MANKNLELYYMNRPVGDLAVLASIDTTNIVNGFIVSVENHSIYQFNKTSTDTADDLNIVEPTVGGGRWFMMSTLYTNTTPMAQTLGGYEPGQTFTKQTPQQVLDGLFYLDPTFSSFSISGQGTTLEIGAEIGGAGSEDQTFVWTTTNSSKIQTNSIDIEDITGAANLFTGLANDGTEDYTFPAPVTRTTVGNYRWRIIGTNFDLDTFQRNFDVSYEWRIYWGTSANTALNEAEIKALANNRLDTNTPGTYSFAAGNYKYFAWPSSFTQPTTFKDDSTGFAVAMELPFIVNITNANGVATNYSVYRTTNILAGTIDIVVAT